MLFPREAAGAFRLRIPPLMHSSAQQHHDLGATFCIRSHRSAQSESLGLGTSSARTAHRHAEVLSFNDDGNAIWPQILIEKISDLRRQAFLHLRPLGKTVDDPGKFGKSDDLAPLGDIGDMRLADERQQMMLTNGIERDIAHDDKFLVLLRLIEQFQELPWILFETGKDFSIHICNALRRLEKSLAVRVFPNCEQELTHCRLYSFFIHHFPPIDSLVLSERTKT